VEGLRWGATARQDTIPGSRGQRRFPAYGASASAWGTGALHVVGPPLGRASLHSRADLARSVGRRPRCSARTRAAKGLLPFVVRPSGHRMGTGHVERHGAPEWCPWVSRRPPCGFTSSQGHGARCPVGPRDTPPGIAGLRSVHVRQRATSRPVMQRKRGRRPTVGHSCPGPPRRSHPATPRPRARSRRRESPPPGDLTVAPQDEYLVISRAATACPWRSSPGTARRAASSRGSPSAPTARAPTSCTRRRRVRAGHAVLLRQPRPPRTGRPGPRLGMQPAPVPAGAPSPGQTPSRWPTRRPSACRTARRGTGSAAGSRSSGARSRCGLTPPAPVLSLPSPCPTRETQEAPSAGAGRPLADFLLRFGSGTGPSGVDDSLSGGCGGAPSWG
jgi:hypothetical protein